MEPMNPYERRIIHSAIGKMEGVRSESKGEGRDRRVVIYSTDPNAQNNAGYGERRGNGNGGRFGGRGGRGNGGRTGGSRGPRSNGNGNSRGGYRNNRNGNDRNENRGPRPSSVPERSYVTRDAEEAAPVAPKRTERVDDFADFSFGKIDL
jgi:spoIIIJ-associated protein